MKTEIKRNQYLILCGMWLIALACYSAFYLLSVKFLQKTTLLATMCGYLLFPVFSIIYGVLSYRITRCVLIPNLLYVLFAFFSVIIMGVWSIFVNHSVAMSPFWRTSINVFPVYALMTILSITASVLIAAASSLLTMTVSRILQKRRFAVMQP